MTDYKHQLWDEIARNDPIMAKALAAAKPFKPTLVKFRWLQEPRVIVCKYERKET